MDFNKIVSLILGFVIFVLLFLWIGNKLKPSNKITKTTVQIITTPTPTKKPWQNPLAFLFNGGTTPTLTPSPTSAQNPEIISPTPSQTNAKNGTQNTNPTQAQTVLIYKSINNTTIKPEVKNNNQTKTYQTNQKQTTYTTQTTATQIPKTGIATLFIPMSLGGLIGGLLLKKKAK